MNPLWITVNLEFGSTCTGRWGVGVILVIFQQKGIWFNAFYFLSPNCEL